MKMRYAAMGIALMLATPALAQDLPTDQLDRHAEVVRQDMLVRSTVGRSVARQNGRTASRATPSQVATCAKKAQFRAQYGAANPKVRRLYSLCRGRGL